MQTRHRYQGREKPTGPACAHGKGGKPRKAGPAQACQRGGERGSQRHGSGGGLFGNWGVRSQLWPDLAPVITQVFAANNAGAKPLNGYALLNRHATRFPVADGSGRNVQLFSHDRAPAKVAGGPVKRVLAWNDGKRIDLHSRILTRGVFIGQHHMFTQPVFNAAT